MLVVNNMQILFQDLLMKLNILSEKKFHIYNVKITSGKISIFFFSCLITFTHNYDYYYNFFFVLIGRQFYNLF